VANRKAELEILNQEHRTKNSKLTTRPVKYTNFKNLQARKPGGEYLLLHVYEKKLLIGL
jgi:hypothetical protein